MVSSAVLATLFACQNLHVPSKEYKILAPILVLVEINERLISSLGYSCPIPTRWAVGIFQAAKRMKNKCCSCWEKASFARLRNLELPNWKFSDISTRQIVSVSSSKEFYVNRQNVHGQS